MPKDIQHIPDSWKYKKFYGVIIDSPTSGTGGPDSLFACADVFKKQFSFKRIQLSSNKKKEVSDTSFPVPSLAYIISPWLQDT